MMSENHNGNDDEGTDRVAAKLPELSVWLAWVVSELVTSHSPAPVYLTVQNLGMTPEEVAGTTYLVDSMMDSRPERAALEFALGTALASNPALRLDSWREQGRPNPELGL